MQEEIEGIQENYLNCNCQNLIPWYDATWNLVINFLMLYGIYKIYIILKHATHWHEWIWMIIAIFFLLLCKK